MTMTLDIAPEMEAYLREKAAREGQAAETVAQALLMQAIQTDAQSRQRVLLQDYSIGPAQAAELRAIFATFAGEWERTEMNVYDDYDAAKARLAASGGVV